MWAVLATLAGAAEPPRVAESDPLWRWDVNTTGMRVWFTPEGHWLATGSGEAGLLVMASSWKEPRAFPTPLFGLRGISYGRATWRADDGAYVLDVATGELAGPFATPREIMWPPWGKYCVPEDSPVLPGVCADDLRYTEPVRVRSTGTIREGRFVNVAKGGIVPEGADAWASMGPLCGVMEVPVAPLWLVDCDGNPWPVYTDPADAPGCPDGPEEYRGECRGGRPHGRGALLPGPQYGYWVEGRQVMTCDQPCGDRLAGFEANALATLETSTDPVEILSAAMDSGLGVERSPAVGPALEAWAAQVTAAVDRLVAEGRVADAWVLHRTHGAVSWKLGGGTIEAFPVDGYGAARFVEDLRALGPWPRLRLLALHARLPWGVRSEVVDAALPELTAYWSTPTAEPGIRWLRARARSLVGATDDDTIRALAWEPETASGNPIPSVFSDACPRLLETMRAEVAKTRDRLITGLQIDVTGCEVARDNTSVTKQTHQREIYEWVDQTVSAEKCRDVHTWGSEVCANVGSNGRGKDCYTPMSTRQECETVTDVIQVKHVLGYETVADGYAVQADYHAVVTAKAHYRTPTGLHEVNRTLRFDAPLERVQNDQVVPDDLPPELQQQLARRILLAFDSELRDAKRDVWVDWITDAELQATANPDRAEDLLVRATLASWGPLHPSVESWMSVMYGMTPAEAAGFFRRGQSAPSFDLGVPLPRL
ncbi:MAG: hypothetical protein R3F61_32825 [Myxococcota bacterium]